MHDYQMTCTMQLLWREERIVKLQPGIIVNGGKLIKARLVLSNIKTCRSKNSLFNYVYYFFFTIKHEFKILSVLKTEANVVKMHLYTIVIIHEYYINFGYIYYTE